MKANHPLAALLTTAVLGVAGLGLAGCSDDGAAAGPSPSPPASSASISASPSPSESAQPESPEDFIRRWASANNEMKATGDATAFLRMTHACGPCSELANLVGGFYEAGGFVKTRGWRVESVNQAPSPNARQPVYALRVVSAPTTFRETASSQPEFLSGGKFIYRVTLVERGDSWRVADYIQVSQ